MNTRGSADNNNSDQSNERLSASSSYFINAKLRLYSCLVPLNRGTAAIARSSHAVRRMLFKNTHLFFKLNLAGSYISELEACACAFYRLHSPNRVPSKANAHFNELKLPVGVGTAEIENFQSLQEAPLMESDLANDEIVKGIANILVLSYLNKEDDLHINNFSKYGYRIDFDMSFWPIFSYFKKGALLDWFYRTSEPERFRITAKDIDNFPDLEDAQPFYWPTIPQRIINGKIITLSHNAYPPDQIELFKKLKTNPVFIREKFKSMLKYLLIETELYGVWARKKIRESERHPDQTIYDATLVEIMTAQMDERKNELRQTLVDMPTFQDFLWEHGAVVFEEIKQEFIEENERLRARESEKYVKDPNRKSQILNAKLFHTENIETMYNNIFLEAKEFAIAAPRI
ncbi:MAG TPA: hypothetical protein VL360_07390 [Gammaproteobacteria bacterium]|jgi:hypothetical protein|nr:hypothetical protein [Gammaproteobacteria bacterium]